MYASELYVTAKAWHTATSYRIVAREREKIGEDFFSFCFFIRIENWLWDRETGKHHTYKQSHLHLHIPYSQTNNKNWMIWYGMGQTVAHAKIIRSVNCSFEILYMSCLYHNFHFEFFFFFLLLFFSRIFAFYRFATNMCMDIY